jgi:hypothetical protein
MLRKLVISAGMVAMFSIGATGASSGATPTLSASVDAKGSVALIGTDGKKVERLRRGLYRIVVHDRSRRDNFDLVGPQNGLRHATTKVFVGTVTWRLRLSAGIYRYGSDRLPKARASFRVV